jgi:sigma-B regulation protein RsbU (phosphoserine phosphatase)
MPRRFPIRIKLVLAVCLPLLAVYTAILVVEYHLAKDRAIEQMQLYLAEVAARQASLLDGELQVIAQVARSTSTAVADFPPNETSQVEPLLVANLKANEENPNEQIFGTCIAFEAGALGPNSPPCAPYLCRSPDGKGRRRLDIAQSDPNYARQDWYLLPKLLKQSAWTDPYFDEGAGNVLMCTYSVPIERDGRFLGVVTVDVSLERLRQRLSELQIAGGYGFLVSRAGTFVAHEDEELIMAESIFSLAEGHGRPELRQLGQKMVANQADAAAQRVFDYKTGEAKWVIYAPVPSVGWSFAAVRSEQAVMSEVYSHLSQQLGALLAALALIILCVLLAAAWITRPLERLAAVAHTVATGDLTAQVTGITSRDEIGQFATTFNQMVHDLKENVDATVRETAAREAMERELELARQIQTSLLPTEEPPQAERRGFSLHGENKPARFMAGDFFDFWFVDDDVLALVIADVVGKGVPAAMFMAVSRTTIRNFSTAERSPAETLALANRAIAAENREQMFVTVFYGHYHTRSGELVFANGGHNPPFLVRNAGPIENLGSSTGPIVGVWEDAEYEDSRATLDPGDLLVLYTDGVTEARNEADTLLGDEGFCKILQQYREQPVDELCQSIVRDVDVYRRGEGQDDVTLLALRRT